MGKLKYAAVLVGMFLLLISTKANAESFDAAREYTCDQPSSGVWYFEGYRASDDTYLPMVFGHADIKEVSRYGTDAHYLPDSEQMNYPFITRFGDELFASPATKGKRFDAVMAWESPGRYSVTVTGHAEFKGEMAGKEKGKKVKAGIVLGGKTLWEGDVESGKPAKFELATEVNKGDRLRLHIQNMGDEAGDMVSFNIHVETAGK
jgi:hypothetical protein